MRIAILGATSEIARDLIWTFSIKGEDDLTLFARSPEITYDWIFRNNLSKNYQVFDFKDFCSDKKFDVVINFVGIGNPAKASALGASIFDLTLKYDEMVLAYLREHPECRYIFLSSGAVYGSSFEEPADDKTKSVFDVNELKPKDWYGLSKLFAECRHRALSDFSIVDIRIFNYFSHRQNMDSRFFIADIARAIRDEKILEISSASMVRDYIGSEDFFQLINRITRSTNKNCAIDCCSKAPIDKHSLLKVLQEKFGLRYELKNEEVGVSATGNKINYFSVSKKYSEFGYQPKLTSLEVVVNEMQSYLKSVKPILFS